jgi:photosystem I subunit 8
MTTFNNLPSIFVPLVGLVFPAIALVTRVGTISWWNTGSAHGSDLLWHCSGASLLLCPSLTLFSPPFLSLPLEPPELVKKIVFSISFEDGEQYYHVRGYLRGR